MPLCPAPRHPRARSGSTAFRRTAAALGIVLALAASQAQAQTILRDSETERLLRDYSNPLFEAAGLEPNDIQIQIVGDRTLNAFVTNGQRVFLHTGLILEADTPNQLKGVIAHETGHISGGHLARSSDAIRNAMVPAYVTIALGLLAIAAGAPDAGSALLASSQQFAMLSFFTYTRVQEASADQAAVGFLEASGQSGRGLVEFFEKFRYQEVMSEARRAPYFRSHPLSGDRITSLQRRVEEQSNREVVDSPDSVARFEMVKAKIQGFLYTPADTFLRFPASDTSLPARYARAIATYRMPDVVEATRLTQALIDEDPDNPWFHELMAQILFENSRAAESVAPGRRAVELAPQESLLRIGLARSLLAVGGPDNLALAETELRAALRLEPSNAFAWNQLARVADGRGDTGLARLATAEEAFALGDMPRANRFSQAALRNLSRTTPQWQRASDIESITARMAARAARREQEGQRPLQPVTQAPSAWQVSRLSATGAAAAAQAALPGPGSQHDHDHDHDH